METSQGNIFVNSIETQTEKREEEDPELNGDIMRMEPIILHL